MLMLLKAKLVLANQELYTGAFHFSLVSGLRKPVKELPMFVDCAHGAVMFGILLCCELLYLTKFRVPTTRQTTHLSGSPVFRQPVVGRLVGRYR